MILARFQRFVAAETRATGLPIGALLVASAVWHVVVTVVAANPWHPDEHFQILELAWARAGLGPESNLPWEFGERMRATLQPLLAMGLLCGLRVAGVESPFVWVTALRLLTVAAAFVVLLGVIATRGSSLTVRGRRVLWLASTVLWFFPMFDSRFTAENFGGLALAGALILLPEGDERGGRKDWWVAVLLGLAFVFRFQTAFAIAGVLLWIAHYRGGWRRAASLVPVILAVVAVSTLIDSWFYRGFTFTPFEYFRVNVIEGVAATFGETPWYTYFVWVPIWMAPPLGLALVGLILGAIWSSRRSPWSWAMAAFLVGHFLVSHKELRFLFPLLYFVPLMAARGWDALERRRPMTGAWRVVSLALVAQNVVLAILLASPAVHRGKDFDWHYFRLLWKTAEARPDELVVIDADGRPYRAWAWDANVYRHPRVRGVRYAPGDSLAALAPGIPADRLLVVTRNAAPPPIVGASGFDIIYESEAGFRVMARWVGAESSAPIQWLERVDRWTDSPWRRRVYRVRGVASP